MSYRLYNNTYTITSSQWQQAGLSIKQLYHATARGAAKIVSSYWGGSTIIDVTSITNARHLAKIEALCGKLQTFEEQQNILIKQNSELIEAVKKLTEGQAMQGKILELLTIRIENDRRMSPAAVQPASPAQLSTNVVNWAFPEPVIDPAVRDAFNACRKPDGQPLKAGYVSAMTNRCAILEAVRQSFIIQRQARAKHGKTVNRADFNRNALAFYSEARLNYPCRPITNANSFSRVYNLYLKAVEAGDVTRLLHAGLGNDNSTVLSDRAKALVLAIWTLNGKPYKTEVLRLFREFAAGQTDIVDKETGEVFRPEEFRYKGRPIRISKGSVQNIINNALNRAAVAPKVEGQFDAVTTHRPHVFMSNPKYSYSMFSMDDSHQSRKAKNGKKPRRYAITDVASGYIFTPAYSRDPLTTDDVFQAFRNMFCETIQSGLPMPGEIQHEHFLLDEIFKNKDFASLFRFTTVTSHPRAKVMERTISSLKWGVAHKNGHTDGRFYGKGRYKTPRVKVKGEFVDKLVEYDRIVQDDLNDIEEYNNSLHPSQKLYPGMTRRDVLLKCYNPDLSPIDKSRLYRHVANRTATTIRNNGHFVCDNETWLIDFECLALLKPNNYKVEAYWIPDGNGIVDEVYLYQGDTFLCRATSVEEVRFNKSKVEETEEDIKKKNRQLGRISHFDKIMNDKRSEIPSIAVQSCGTDDAAAALAAEYTPPLAQSCNPRPDIAPDDWSLDPESVRRRARMDS